MFLKSWHDTCCVQTLWLPWRAHTTPTQTNSISAKKVYTRSCYCPFAHWGLGITLRSYRGIVFDRRWGKHFGVGSFLKDQESLNCWIVQSPIDTTYALRVMAALWPIPVDVGREAGSIKGVSPGAFYPGGLPWLGFEPPGMEPWMKKTSLMLMCWRTESRMWQLRLLLTDADLIFAKALCCDIPHKENQRWNLTIRIWI